MLSQGLLVVVYSVLLFVVQTVSEELKCQIIPIETEEGLVGHCCMFSKRELDRKRFTQQVLGNTKISNSLHISKISNSNEGDFSSARVPIAKDSSTIPYSNPNKFVPLDGAASYNTQKNIKHTSVNQDSRNSGSSRFENSSKTSNGTGKNNRNNNQRNHPSNITNKTTGYQVYTERITTTSSVRDEIFIGREKEIGKKSGGRNNKNVTKTPDIKHTIEETSDRDVKTIPDIGNRNNVNVPETCTEGYAKDASGKCVKIY